MSKTGVVRRERTAQDAIKIGGRKDEWKNAANLADYRDQFSLSRIKHTHVACRIAIPSTSITTTDGHPAEPIHSFMHSFPSLSVFSTVMVEAIEIWE